MRTHYSVEFKLRVLTALDNNDGNIYKTAKEFGIARTILSDWNQRREKLWEQGETLLQQRRLHLAQRMDLIINQIVDAMPKKVEKARLSDSANALRILLSLSKAEAKRAEAEREEEMGVYEKLALIREKFEAVKARQAAENEVGSAVGGWDDTDWQG